MAGLWASKGRDLALDLGSANTRIAIAEQGVVLDEPSVVALDDKGRILAAGSQAKRMLGRTPGNVRTVRPIQRGVITNVDQARLMLRHFLREVRDGHGHPRVLLAVPSGITDVERQAIERTVLRAGARRVETVEDSLAAAVGAGIGVDEPTASMMADVGAGTSSVAVLSLGGIVTSRSLKVGGDDFDQAIARYVRRAHGLLIGDRPAEDLKLAIGSVYPGTALGGEIVLQGKDAATGLPCSAALRAEELIAPLLEPVGAIVDLVKSALDDCPPALAGDLVNRGITVTGGGALLPGFGQLLRQEIGVPVRVAGDPFGSVVIGASGSASSAPLEVIPVASGAKLQLGPALAVGEETFG